jgi:hypothetical protein
MIEMWILVGLFYWVSYFSIIPNHVRRLKLHFWSKSFAARGMVCSWAAENIDALDQFIPLGCPQGEISMESSTYDQAYLQAAQILGGMAAAFVLSKR